VPNRHLDKITDEMFGEMLTGMVDMNRVTTCLENLEMSGNLEHVRELSGKKSCHGKVSQNCSSLDEY